MYELRYLLRTGGWVGIAPMRVLQFRTREVSVGVGCEGASPSAGYGPWSAWQDVPEVDE